MVSKINFEFQKEKKTQKTNFIKWKQKLKKKLYKSLNLKMYNSKTI